MQGFAPARPRALALLSALSLLATPFAFARPAHAAGPRRADGVPVVGAAATTRTTADIMREARITPAEDEEYELENEHQMPSRRGLPQNPASPHLASVPNLPTDQLIYRPKGQGKTTLAPQTVGLSFTGATLSGTNPVSAFPPDVDGCVGPTQYVLALNNRIVSFNKATGAADGVINATTNTFFTSVRNGSGTSDPMVRYDRLSNRWFVTIINVALNDNRWLLAVSDAASNGVISGSTVWTYYFFVPATIAPVPTNSATMFSDYPTLGIDANALYVGVDQFAGSGQPFQQCDAFVIRKSSVLSGGPIVVTAFRALMSSPAVGGNYSGPFAPRGVDNFDPAASEGYLIGTDGNSYGTMWIERIANPGGSPSISAEALTLPAEDGARPVVHPGNTGGYWGYLDALDDRFFQATMRGQQLWTVHNIGVDNTGVSQGTYTADARSAARWFQVNVPTGAGPSNIVQAGTVFTASANNDSLQKNYFIPSLNVSGQGHAAMGFSTAGASNFVNAETVGRLATDPAGTMQTPTAFTSNASSTYNPASDPGGVSAGRPRRWGDYSQTTVDPLDDQTMWTAEEFVDANNSFGVRVAKLVAPPPAAPNAMADVQVGQAAANVTLTGVSSAGSGFFDPGPNLASPARPYNHLAAAISNGAASGTPPTVVSATYVNATTVNLVLNTTSASANLAGQKYTITITNPDGQTAAAAVVHVVNATFTINATAGAGGAIAPSGAVVVNSGADQAFTITPNACFVVADVKVDGVSVGAVSGYTFHNVTANHTIDATFQSGLPTPPTSLVATQVKAGNNATGSTYVNLAWNPVPGAAFYQVFRKGFGGYPLYQNAGGSIPAAPGAYPPAGWTFAAQSSTPATQDTAAARDFYYYVVYAFDACSNASPVSNRTNGTLNYHLGDVSDGATPGQGDNKVDVADASLLGAHYGANGAGLVGFEYLDVGPTGDRSTNARPTVDGVVNFEDLVLFALNFTPAVSVTTRPPAGSDATPAGEVLSLAAPHAVKAGDAFDVPVTLAATGGLQALSATLAWDPAVARPGAMAPGDLVSNAGGLVLSPAAGQVDAALLGVGTRGLVGTGTLATVRFTALADGDPKIGFAHAVGRDAANRDVVVATRDAQGTGTRVTVTELGPVVPNPTRGMAQLSYSLARAGEVDLAIYAVDGRLVRTLAHGVQEPGRYQVAWDGNDSHGSAVKPGVFYARFRAPATHASRAFAVVR